MPRTVFPFDLILFWPLELRLEGVERSEWRDKLRGKLLAGGDWGAVEDPLRRGLEPSEDGYAYAEWCDVHPFVRRFLYGDGSERGTFDLYRLESAAIRAIEIDEEKCKIVFGIESCRLYVADGGLAFVILDLSARDATDWEQALRAISNFRGIYPKFFANYSGKRDDPKAWSPGEVFERVRLLPLEAERTIDDILAEHNKNHPPGRRLDEALNKDNRQPPILRHWTRLLRPLFEIGVSPHVLSDHRLSLMTWMAVEEIKSISRDDWMALCEADSPGFVTYSPEFRDAELAAAGYDRWWREAPADGSRDEHLQRDHRYLVGAKVYASVKGRPSGDMPEWFVGMTDRMRKSWRRQYAQVYFLAQYQRAFLLKLQDRVAAAAERVPGRNADRPWLETLEQIQADLALFSSRQWFVEVSAQVQPQQLYEKIKERLGIDRLYRGVVEDKSLLAAWATAREERQRERWWSIVNDVAIPIGLILAFLGANVIVQPLEGLLQEFFIWICAAPDGGRSPCLVVPRLWFKLFVDLVMTGALGFLAWRGYILFREWREDKDKRKGKSSG